MCLWKKNIDNLEKTELIDAICSLEREVSYIEEQIKKLSDDIQKLIISGQELKNNYEKIFVVKKISNLNDERTSLIKQGLYVLYNIKMATKLKDVMENNEIVKRISQMKFAVCMKDQKELAKFLNKSLGTKTAEENILTEADDVFASVESMYMENLKIYIII